MPRTYRGARILGPSTQARLRRTDKERSAARSMPLADRDASSGRFQVKARHEVGRSRTLKPRR